MAEIKNTIILDDGYLRLPSGTTAQRPGSPVAGMMRYNSDLGVNEYYDGTYWSTDIVTSGLTLWLDAGNTASYPGSGTTWFDLSSSGLNATGSTAISGGSLSDTQPYTTATTGILNTDTHSIFFMLQINGTNGSWSKIFGYEAGGSDRTPGIWRRPNERSLHWRYDPGNTGTDIGTSLSASAEFNINNWYYVGVTKNGSDARVYTNGSFLGSFTSANPKTAGTAPIKLYPSYNQGTSKMAVVHIYNRVLSAAEIQLNYSALKASNRI